MHRTSILIFMSYITIILSGKVTWLPNTSFNLEINFKDGKLPCSKQTVVFPETVSGTIQIESGTSVRGFVLPMDGEIFLAEGTIELGPTEELNCTDDNVYYMERSVASWAQPGVWSSPKFNKAMPDAERVPCYDDIVVFPSKNAFTVVLPDSTQSVQGIELGGEMITTSSFRDYITDQSNQAQQFILNNYHTVGILTRPPDCKSRSGCPCQINMLDMDCSAKFCEVPTCIDPIQPTGHCCKICGGTILFDIDNSFEIMKFKELVERIVDTYGKDDLIYHIGRLPNNKVQVVVVDKNRYDQTSVQVVNTISYNMERHFNQKLQMSGIPLDKSGFGWKIFFSMFFAVALVMAGIYVYYYKVPEMNYSIIRGRSQPGMFSRFNRRTESVVSLTRRDSVAPIGVSTGTAFRNPLYDSTRGRVSVEESISEERE